MFQRSKDSIGFPLVRTIYQYKTDNMSNISHVESSRKRARSYPLTDCSSNSCPSSGSRSLITSVEDDGDVKWKGMYQESERKNTELNLQLCFVRSECLRLLRVQNDMAQSISTLQVGILKLNFKF